MTQTARTDMDYAKAWGLLREALSNRMKQHGYADGPDSFTEKIVLYAEVSDLWMYMSKIEEECAIVTPGIGVAANS